MIVSRLKLTRTSSALSLPRYDIVERELLYASPIHGTPLLGEDEIDAERIGELLSQDYEKAGISPRDLKTGAVIITGETANKKNASRIVHLLAERSGDFVVATAGADLEGLLAGKGAGADRRSMHTRGAVANLDVGGGTANVAFFARGKPAGTVTFHVGGRLIQVDPAGTIEAVSPSLRPWLEASGFAISPGQTVGFPLLREICAAMCRDMLDYLARCALPAGGKETIRKLMLGDPLPSVPVLEEWTVSGGIGGLMAAKAPDSLAETAVHGDIGPLLAHALRQCCERYPIRLAQPDQTVRATVIGAGMQSTEISGATVHLDASLLPIRNLPVLKLDISPHMLAREALLKEAAAGVMRTAASLFEQDASPPFALALSGMKHCSYESLQWLSDALAERFREAFPASRAMVVVCENDLAKALGQSLDRRCGGRPGIVCIDQIRVEYGDYIDLGEPISGVMIPVVVKTLAFHNRTVGGTHA